MNSVDALDYKCPNCGAVLTFNPHGQNWHCDYCRSTFTKKEIDEYEQQRRAKEKTLTEAEALTDANVYACPSCGAQIVADENTSATFCVYCKNTAILKHKLEGAFNPTKIIPFHKTKEDAIQAFKDLGKGHPLMPRLFNNQKNIDEIRGIYIPFWLYNYDVSGNLVADARKISSWTSGDYNYTKTDYYNVSRSGRMLFQRIPVDGSTHFDNSIMNSIEPFNYDELTPFSPSYLSGFLAEKYDVDVNNASIDALTRVKQSVIDALRADIHGYSSVSISNQNQTINSTNSDYVLLPVWLLNVKYNNKIYTFAMNGQTGKLIGNIPIDKKRAVLYWLMAFAIFLIAMSIFFLIVISTIEKGGN